jgi:hypothetical protein
MPERKLRAWSDEKALEALEALKAKGAEGVNPQRL